MQHSREADKELENQIKSPLPDPNCWIKDPQPFTLKWIPFNEDINNEKTKRERRECYVLNRLNLVTCSEEEADIAPSPSKDPQIQT